MRNARVINDFSIQVATVNGSGSQSANMVLMRSIFQMGVPVSGKNLFPSNIAGLPTWFTIRASKHGYIARRAEIDFMVAMNPQTAREDAMLVQPGGALLAEQSLGLKGLRGDISYYEVPFSKLASEVSSDARLRKLLANMVYVGVMTDLLALDTVEVEKAIRKQFKTKAKAAETNVTAMRIGAEYARSHLQKTDPFRVERMNKTQGKIIIDGNAAAALGAMFGGCTVVTWYPITPSTSLVETMIDYMKEYRIDPKTGKATFAIVQAEDELAAVGMVIGAGWAGARAMTSTSGPGISLMSEFVGLAYFTEIPAVIWDIQRVGPSTGLPTRTSQGDILSTYFLSHGDTRHVMLLPATVEECFRFAQDAFNLSEKFQTPVFCMSDLDLGMNNWMADPFAYPEDIPIERGKVLSAEDLEKIGTFARYRDLDGDGIPYRTLPGTNHPAAAYFTRGSGHNEQAEYTERPEDYVRLMDRLDRKIENARASVPEPAIEIGANAGIGIIAYGSTHHAIAECRDQLKNEYGLETDYMRIRALPLSPAAQTFIEAHDKNYVVEQNRDGQMRSILSLDYPMLTGRLRSVLHYDGIPIDARYITNAIIAQEKEKT
ncbi:MAG TPA: 2-oxoacid:acceptor oxidoreductase subunit alpha [Acidobacteriota bacterium]|nr:2-oxoacid:acceptor oxidoreductase subunit alpha [Acidobacteriota bacterium]